MVTSAGELDFKLAFIEALLLTSGSFVACSAAASFLLNVLLNSGLVDSRIENKLDFHLARLFETFISPVLGRQAAQFGQHGIASDDGGGNNFAVGSNFQMQ